MTGLATVPGVSVARGGGGGARPTNPSLLAARALNAAMGDDQDTALQLYDYGVQNYGEDFLSAFYQMRKDREASDAAKAQEGGLKRVSTIVGADMDGPGQTKAGTASHAFPAPLYGDFGPGSTSAGTAAGAVPDPVLASQNTAAGTASGRPPDPLVGPGETGAGTSLNTVAPPLEYPGRTMAGTASALSVSPEGTGDTRAGTSAGRSPEVITGPGETVAGTSTNTVAPPLEYPGRTMAGTANGLSVPTPTDAPPVDAGLRSVPRSQTAAGTAGGRDFFDVGSGRAEDEPGSWKSGRYKGADGKWHGEYRDAPPGPQTIPYGEDATPDVTLTAPTTRAGVAGTGGPKPAVADPSSGGLASTVQAPPQATGAPIQLTPAAASAPPAGGPPGPEQPPPNIDEGFMGKPDIWSFLTSAGLGAMASGSTTALGAIGAGGTAGLNQLGVLRKDQRERAKNLADAQFQKDRIALGYAGEAGQNYRTGMTNQTTRDVAAMQDQGATNRTGMQIGSNEKVATLQDQGATARTGMTNQTTRDVATMQDQGATNRTGMTNQTTRDVATMQDQGATNRTGMQIGSNEKVANIQDQGATNRTGMTNQTTRDVATMQDQGATQRLNRQGEITQMLKQQEEELRRQGKVIDRDELYDFGISHGGSQDEVRQAILDIKEHPAAQSPMSKDEIAQSLDLVAGNLLGQGHNNQELVAVLPQDVLAEVYQEIGKHNNSSSASAAAMAIIQKRGWFRDDSVLGGRFGFSKEFKFERAPAAASSAQPPASSSSAASASSAGPGRRYDPATGKLVDIR
jgi:hypothetical protein